MDKNRTDYKSPTYFVNDLKGCLQLGWEAFLAFAHFGERTV
ncbi:hypothetical protein CHCC14818_2812 [Bacillus licheniformis]|nr:hypothetical protein CHCC14818_2812 [Bacillus licheniformis]TWN07026.1 hypothetical protein CHCC14566_2381 [Bacillus licheniformis]